MRWCILDLFTFFLLVFFFVGARPVKPLQAFNDDYLSPQTGTYLRGIFALVVNMHHLSQQLPVGVLFSNFSYVGYHATSVFFFLSGYGLMKSHMTRDDYRVHFLRRRIPKIIVPYILMTLVYWGLRVLSGNDYSVKDYLLDMLNGKPIVSNSWFIICILGFYVLFWVLMHLFQNHYAWIPVGACVWCVLYTAFCIRMQYGIWWYRTAPILIVGIVWAMHERSIVKALQNAYRFLTPLLFLIFFVLFYIFKHFAEDIPSMFVRSLLVILLVSSFIFCICVFTMKLKIGNPVLAFLGKISLEIYLVHGLFIHYLRSDFLYIHNDLLWVLLCLAGSVALGAALHTLTAFVTKYAFKKECFPCSSISPR